MAWTPLVVGAPGTPGHTAWSQQVSTWANAFHTQVVNSSIILSDLYGLVIVTSDDGVRTLTLPSAATAGRGGYLIIRDGSNNVVLNRAGSDTFNDGSTSKTLASDGASIAVVSQQNQTTWYITGERGSVT